MLLTFAVGFLARPVGSAVLSPLADRHGRQRVLVMTIVMMGIGSLIVAVMPSFAQVGMLTAARIRMIPARLHCRLTPSWHRICRQQVARAVSPRSR